LKIYNLGIQKKATYRQPLLSFNFPELAENLYSEHTGKAVGASFITSLLAGIAGSSSDGSGSDNRSSGQEAINHAISNVLNTGNEIVKKKLEVGATAIIRPGFEFNVMLNSDLALEPYYGE